ncbi:MAG: formylmethanofuran dehydrogenase subunit E family protein, partial [Planctomycetota bacterium]
MTVWSYGSCATTGPRSSARSLLGLGIAATLGLTGCDAGHDHEHAHGGDASHTHTHGDDHHAHGAHHTHAESGNDHHNPATWGELPEWALRTAQLHGGLGPWAISGAIAGLDARERLAPASNEVLEVVYKLPIGVDEAPNMCVADGLQVGAGVSFGKKTIEVRHTDSIPLLRDDGLACASGVSVFVVRDAAGTPLRALEYRPSDELRLLLEEGTLGSLADDARSIIPRPASELFDVTPVEGEALASLLDE